jgi:maleylpyruvate isomerase
MAGRTFADARRWTEQGTELFLARLAHLDDDRLDEPTDLSGWTRRHLVAHVTSNAEALNRLVTWAATGVETPMYDSPEQRAADIDAGALLEPTTLRERATVTAKQLATGFDALTDEQWTRPVRTAQGRIVPATEIPWLRAREVCVHAVDLARSGFSSLPFTDLPAGFTTALVEDVAVIRSTRADGPSLFLRATDAADTWTVRGDGIPREVAGTVSGLAAWLTGRGDHARTADFQPLPALPRWL